jgi:hypothetical protein
VRGTSFGHDGIAIPYVREAIPIVEMWDTFVYLGIPPIFGGVNENTHGFRIQVSAGAEAVKVQSAQANCRRFGACDRIGSAHERDKKEAANT